MWNSVEQNIEHEKVKQNKRSSETRNQKIMSRNRSEFLATVLGAFLSQVYSVEKHGYELVFFSSNVLYCGFLTLLHHESVCFEMKKHMYH